MNADKVDESKIQNKEAYNGIKEAMLQDGAIPKEIIEKDKAIQEQKEMQEKLKAFGDISSVGTNFIESFEKKYPNIKHITRPIKIIVKKAGLPFEIIDLVLEYQINGNDSVIVKIGGKVLETIILGAGFSIATAIASLVATKFALAGVVGFIIFAAMAVPIIWVASQSEDLFRFIYENVYIRAKKEKDRVLNCIDYIGSGKWYDDLRYSIIKATKNKIKETIYLIIENPIGRFILK